MTRRQRRDSCQPAERRGPLEASVTALVPAPVARRLGPVTRRESARVRGSFIRRPPGDRDRGAAGTSKAPWFWRRRGQGYAARVAGAIKIGRGGRGRGGSAGRGGARPAVRRGALAPRMVRADRPDASERLTSSDADARLRGQRMHVALTPRPGPGTTFGPQPRRLPMRTSLPIALALTLLAPSLALAQRTSVSGDVPIYANGGLPDLTPDPKRFVSQMEIVDRLFNAGDCELVEGSVGGTGYRRLLRFDMVI